MVPCKIEKQHSYIYALEKNPKLVGYEIIWSIYHWSGIVLNTNALMSTYLELELTGFWLD